jgi:ubiquinone biosynthesis protein COQ4
LTIVHSRPGKTGSNRSTASFDYGLHPLRALKAFRRLVADKEDTEQVFEIMRALAGRSMPYGYARLLESKEGARQAYARVELVDRLEDEGWLASLRPGSVGAAYGAFVTTRALSAYGLAQQSRKLRDVDIDATNAVTWYVRRLRDIHDVWHVLTGYGVDALGEACLVAFSFAQTGSAGFALIAGGAAFEFQRVGQAQPYTRAIWQAWRHGARAAWLPALDYDALFSLPLDDVRNQLRIAAPTVYEAVPAKARNGFRPKKPPARSARTP